MSDRKFYTIDVKTWDVWYRNNEGTNNDVEVKLKGENGTTDYIQLKSWNDENFEAGSNRTFYLGWHDIGNLTSVEFQLKNDPNDFNLLITRSDYLLQLLIFLFVLIPVCENIDYHHEH